jgi:hypothetical protein
MSAPEHRHDSDKWVAEAMGMVGTCVGAAMFGHVEHEQQSLDALRAHLQRQADLMERMGEALKVAVVRMVSDWEQIDSEWGPTKGGLEGDIERGEETVIPQARAALTAFQEGKQ